MNPMAGARFLIGLLVIGLVAWACFLVLGAMHIPPPWDTVVLIILVLIGLAYLLGWVGWAGPPAPPG